jgi:hypothetical protein
MNSVSLIPHRTQAEFAELFGTTGEGRSLDVDNNILSQLRDRLINKTNLRIIGKSEGVCDEGNLVYSCFGRGYQVLKTAITNEEIPFPASFSDTRIDSQVAEGSLGTPDDSLRTDYVRVLAGPGKPFHDAGIEWAKQAKIGERADLTDDERSRFQGYGSMALCEVYLTTERILEVDLIRRTFGSS